MSTGIAASSTMGPPVGARVRLSSNESPFGPSPKAVAAAGRAMTGADRYPDDQSVELRRVIAATEGLQPDQVSVGTGSAAVLLDIVGEICRDGGEVLTFARSFIVFRLAAGNVQAPYVEVADSGPATLGRDGYLRDVDALVAAITDRTRLILIDNPGNPTGSFLTGAQLRSLIERVPDHVTLAIDEAYHHFASGQHGYQTVAELGVEHPRLLSVRTFSKAYALAGMRIGYVTGPADLIGSIDSRRTRFNVAAPAQAAAVASLTDLEHLKATIDGIMEGKQRLVAGLRALDVPFTEGLGNFVTVECGAAAAPIIEAYGQRGIGVRGLTPYGMNEQFRVSVGTAEEIDAFLEASAELLGPSRSTS